MSDSTTKGFTRRAALTAIFAVGLHCALAGRARAETAAPEAAAHGRVVVTQQRRTEGIEPLRRSLEHTAGRPAAAPVEGHAPLAGDDAGAAPARAGALCALEGTVARAERACAPTLAQVSRAHARAAGSGCARTTTASRSSRRSSAIGCASAGSEPRPRSASACWSAAAPARSGAPSQSDKASYCAVAGGGVFGICFVFEPGLAQLIT